jgi:putative spermidine/putrescine transport system ATP-binding protein
MRAGRMEQCAAPAELYDRPTTAFVAEFVGTMNHLTGTMIDADVVEVAGQRLPVDGERPIPGTKVKVLLRPEAIGLEAAEASAETQSGPTGGTGTGLGTVRVATFLGSITRITVLLDDGTEVKADVPSHRAAEFPAAGRVRLVPAPRPVLVVEP